MHMHEPKMLVESKGLREDVIDEWSNGSVIKFFIFSFLSSSDQVFLVVFIKCINFRMDVLSIPPPLIITALLISKTKSGTVPNS